MARQGRITRSHVRSAESSEDLTKNEDSHEIKEMKDSEKRNTEDSDVRSTGDGGKDKKK